MPNLMKVSSLCPAVCQMILPDSITAAKSYACGNMDCITKPEGAPIFNTWSALQKHIKAEHPPACPHAECGGQLFANTAQLRKHLKMIHKQVEQVAEGESAPRRLGREAEYRRANARKRSANQRRRETEEEMGTEGEGEEPEEEEEPGLTDREESDAPEYNEGQEGAMHAEEEDESDRDMPWHCVEDQCERSFATVRLVSTSLTAVSGLTRFTGCSISRTRLA